MFINTRCCVSLHALGDRPGSRLYVLHNAEDVALTLRIPHR
jgi:hypothetical protein